MAETAYGFTLAQDDAQTNIFDSSLQQAGGFAASPQGQIDELKAVANVLRNVPGGHGIGLLLLGARVDRAGPGPAGTRPTATPATAGRTRRCSGTTPARCRSWRPSALPDPGCCRLGLGAVRGMRPPNRPEALPRGRPGRQGPSKRSRSDDFGDHLGSEASMHDEIGSRAQSLQPVADGDDPTRCGLVHPRQRGRRRRRPR